MTWFYFNNIIVRLSNKRTTPRWLLRANIEEITLLRFNDGYLHECDKLFHKNIDFVIN